MSRRWQRGERAICRCSGSPIAGAVAEVFRGSRTAPALRLGGVEHTCSTAERAGRALVGTQPAPAPARLAGTTVGIRCSPAEVDRWRRHSAVAAAGSLGAAVRALIRSAWG